MRDTLFDLMSLLNQVPNWVGGAFAAISGFSLAKISAYFNGADKITSTLTSKKSKTANVIALLVFLFFTCLMLLIFLRQPISQVIYKKAGIKPVVTVYISKKKDQYYFYSSSKVKIVSELPFNNGWLNLSKKSYTNSK